MSAQAELDRPDGQPPAARHQREQRDLDCVHVLMRLLPDASHLP
jgi:hypothetical protein